MTSMARVTALAALVLPTVSAADAYVFTSFRGNGETGVYLALSYDGYAWKPVKNNQPVVKPQITGMLMRDPFLTRGRDGSYHMIWTWGWNRGKAGEPLRLGYTSSRDLVTWTPQREIQLMGEEPTARNLWAPEMFWDHKAKHWIIFWSTTIPGRFPDTEGTGDSGYNHRMYQTTTRDFKTFTPTKLFFDPGYNVIDGTLLDDKGKFILFFKDERKNPLMKRLRMATGPTPAGPWSDVTDPFTGDWVEGPSALKVNGEYFVYFDHYTNPHHYGAVKSSDLKTWEDVSSRMSFPADHRHGTVLRIDAATAKRLEQLQ